MEQYELSRQQREQAINYFFEYICQDAEMDSSFESALEEKYSYIGIIAREEMPIWINLIEEQIRKDISCGQIDLGKARSMDLEQVLKESAMGMGNGPIDL